MRYSLATILCLWTAMAAQTYAQETGFFRINGPVTTTITSLDANGYLTWTNEATNATFTVQKASVLSPTNWNDYVQVPATNATTRHWIFDKNPPSGMALIPAGDFTMGDVMGDGDTRGTPVHSVYVGALYMDKYEVTKAQWDGVYAWAANHDYGFANPGSGKAFNHPVQTVGWYDCVKWCNARSQQEGRTPAYYTDAAMTVAFKTGQSDPYVRWNAGYRLPTEAEWEKAARGGVGGKRFPWGDTITHNQANYYSSANYSYDISSTRGYHSMYNDGVMPSTSPVGSFAPNGYGLYDMAGNVWEWCWNWYGSYSSTSQTDPRGPATGSARVFRGGSWYDYAVVCRVASRSNSAGDPNLRFSIIGFRSVLPSGQ